MRILFPIHLYLPHHNAGGETYVHNLALFLISKGHQVRVLLKQAQQVYNVTEIYNYEGVEVFPQHAASDEWHFLWADMVISHLGFAEWSMHMAKIFKRPFVFIAHNDCFDEYENIYLPLPGFEANIIYNSSWLRDSIRKKAPSTEAWSLAFGREFEIILHPMVNSDQWDDNMNHAGGLITLINCNENKGGKIFQQIVDRIPERSFIAVTGGYDEQFIPKADNCTVLPNSPNIRSVYAKTRILLVPSKYESYGMVAAEAMCSGIPVICTKTPGLMENCGEAAIYIEDRESIDEWVAAIKKLDNLKTYQKYSKLARERSRHNDPLMELGALEKFLYDIQERSIRRLQQQDSPE